jgi:hypothetical protein
MPPSFGLAWYLHALSRTGVLGHPEPCGARGRGPLQARSTPDILRPMDWDAAGAVATSAAARVALLLDGSAEWRARKAEGGLTDPRRPGPVTEHRRPGASRPAAELHGGRARGRWPAGRSDRTGRAQGCVTRLGGACHGWTTSGVRWPHCRQTAGRPRGRNAHMLTRLPRVMCGGTDRR